MPLLIVGLLVAALVARLIAGSLDGSRIADYLQGKGAVLVSRRWTPFGKGWFGSEKERIYAICYRDRDGHEHQATCKTSLFAGVYLTEDRVVREGRAPLPERTAPIRRPLPTGADPVSPPLSDGDAAIRIARLETENRQLREEIDRLRLEQALDDPPRP